MNIDQKIIDRFMSYVKPDPITKCWEWTGGKHRQGYGMFQNSSIKRTITAHRFSAIIHGLDISGPVLRHTCHNTGCCNPEHLITGTHKDNTQDMIKAGRSNAFGGKTNKKFPDELIEQVRNAYALGNISQSALGRKYNMSLAMVNFVINRKRR